MKGKIALGVEILRKEGVMSLLTSVASYLYFVNYLRPAVDDSRISMIWLLKPIYNIIFNIRYGEGTDVMSEDWDTLILLDACRYDDFEDVHQRQGELTYRLSKGVDSPTFINRNFSEKKFNDTVYVTANPHTVTVKDNFYSVNTTPLTNWNSTMECVMPKQVTKAATEAHKHHKNKRVIVHYMQPHDPPIGPMGTKLLSSNNISGTKSSVDERYISALKNGIIDKKDAKMAYRESLSIVLQEVQVLIENIDGKVVISSDHGEMFGEKPYSFLPRLYEHYQNPRTLDLCKVPWLELNATEQRRYIQSGKSRGKVEINKNDIEEQLEALGYK